MIKLATQNLYDRLLLSAGDGDFEDAISYVKSDLHKEIWISGFTNIRSRRIYKATRTRSCGSIASGRKSQGVNVGHPAVIMGVRTTKIKASLKTSTTILRSVLVLIA